jgi:hypothetical protein
MELLDKYAETQDKLKSVIIKSEDLVESRGTNGRRRTGGRGSVLTELRLDAERMRLRHDGYKTLSAGRAPRDESRYSSVTYDGSNCFQYRGGDEITIYRDPDRALSYASSAMGVGYFGKEVMGYFYGDDWPDERVDSILRKAKRISVRDRMERVGRSRCYVIDAISKRGRYTLWIDPQRGYNIAKAQVLRGARDCDSAFGDRWRGKIQSMSASVRDVRFKSIQGVWVPVEADVERRSENTKGSVSHRKTRHKRTDVILNPDHQALGSFYPDDVPCGTKLRHLVFTFDSPPELDDGGEFRWQPGAEFVVNDKRRVVRSDPNKHLLSIIKVFDIEDVVEDFKLTPAPTATKGKHAVLCFWDINQEQSQQLLMTLRDRQQALAQKGVLLLGVEASGAQTDKVRSWAKKNELTFPVGAFYGRFERLLMAHKKDLDDHKEKMVLSDLVTDLKTLWTVEKLPWLILADRNHVVAAEGFSPKELDEKIKDAEEAEVITNKIPNLASEKEEDPSTGPVGGYGLAGGGG